jgi:hypothetical protein
MGKRRGRRSILKSATSRGALPRLAGKQLPQRSQKPHHFREPGAEALVGSGAAVFEKDLRVEKFLEKILSGFRPAGERVRQIGHLVLRQRTVGETPCE